MKRSNQSLAVSLCFAGAFLLWTAAISWFDVQPIGPYGSSVGFAGMNSFFHQLTGVHFFLYSITDWLSLIPLFLCMGFGCLGLVQWIKRKSIRKVDFDLILLGGFYLITISVYLFFETVAVNYRPVLIDGALEASYPSSTTMLTLCVMQTAAKQLNGRIINKPLRTVVIVTIHLFTAFMVFGRLLSGVHWLTDIIGGVLISMALIKLYDFLCPEIPMKQNKLL